MSRYEDLLFQQGQSQAEAIRARAAVWGDALRQLGQTPLLIQQQRRQSALMLLEQARELRARGEYDLAQKKFEEAERTHNNQQQITRAMFVDDPAKPNVQKGVQRAIELNADPAYAYELGEKFKPKLTPVTTRDAAGMETTVMQPEAAGLVTETKPPLPPALGTIGQYLAIKAREKGSDLSAADIAVATKEYETAKQPPVPPSPSQTHMMRIPGVGDVPVDYVPNKDGSGGKVFYLGKDVSATARQIPSPAIQVQNMITADAKAAGPVDANRPDPATANIPDPKTGMTPNAMFQGAVTFALEGKPPSVGLGNNPRAAAIRAGVANKAGALAAAAGVDLPQLQAEYKANALALNKLLPQAKATATAANTATDNLDLALRQSTEVTRTGAKLVNHYVQWAQGNLTPATGLTKFETYVYTAAREYAKVTGGGALSAQGLTDSAAKEATKLLNTAQSADAFAAAVDAMKGDMANVITEQGKTLAGISSTIGNFFSVTNGGRPVDAPPPGGGAGQTYQVGGFTIKVKP